MILDVMDRMTKKFNGFVEITYTRVTTLTVYLVVLSLPAIEDVLSLSSPNSHNSGLYVDNGQDQTVIYRLTTQEEKIALEHEILKLLGLPDKPNNVNGKTPMIKRSAPKFLLSIYEKSFEDERKSERNAKKEEYDFYFTKNDLKIINQSDSIVTFSAQQKHRTGKPERVKRIWFNVDAAPKDELMTLAELRLYRGPDAKNLKNRGAFTITVYRVTRSSEGERRMQFVDTTNTTAGQEGWITLNVTESLDHWMNNPQDNKGLYLSVYSIDRSSHETRPEDIGIVGFKGDAERQPFMTGFFKSTRLNQLRIYHRSSLDDIEILSIHKKKRDTYNIRNLLADYYNRMASHHSNKPCGINTLYVSFKDLQWQDWIIAPDGYDAYYCAGECKFPLTSHMNATNHAIVQTLVHLARPSTIPKPCCIPTKLSTISVLYFHDDQNVVLKKYKNMAVRACGCH
ncbi:protein 60A-like [Venturia canescens]|uniref:protein 60A-like n=1 Tax=Venturia canescens TaxID=32260 RepID=UPI001C9C19F6|nr:protein 60A-like [Venturia canescens]